ncbi:MAG: UDP-N-acetylglucosamine 2-epimerase (non-hydrolyzing) [Bacillota bacterium]
MRVKVLVVFGTRPEAIKMAPVIRELEAWSQFFLVRVAVTAQHREMLDQVIDHFHINVHHDLDIMSPRQTLTGVTLRALEGLDAVLLQEKPDICLVQGDTITTFAGALAAFFHRVPVGHVEAGLRTGDKYAPYPEEMSRRLAGVVADLHFAPTAWARDNLITEGIDPARVYVTGNSAIDALLLTVKESGSRHLPVLDEVGDSRMVLVDCHRRENFGERMRCICEAVGKIARDTPGVTVVFSVHRNPEVADVAHSVLSGQERVILVDPLPYPEWCNLLAHAYLVVTDSGGIQEEAPSLGTPVLLCRDVTERPEALESGTVRLVGTDRDRIVQEVGQLLADSAVYQRMKRTSNPYGDGRASQRIAQALAHYFRMAPPPEEFRP